MATESRFYSVFGSLVWAEPALPELAVAAEGAADVTIRLGAAPAPEGAARIADGVVADAGRFWMDVPGVARILVRAGSEIVVEPAAGADEAAIRVFLLGSAMGALLHQRGLLPLHASAVLIDGGAVAFMGASGAGKSTIALHLADRGHSLLSDDICALEVVAGGALLHPGPRRMKLWEGSLAATGRSASGLARVLPTLDKFQLPMPDDKAAGAVPLRAVVQLDHGATTGLAPLPGAAAARALIANTFRGELVAPMGRSRPHFDQCLALARVPGVLALTREWSLDRLAAASETLESGLTTLAGRCHPSDPQLS